MDLDVHLAANKDSAIEALNALERDLIENKMSLETLQKLVSSLASQSDLSLSRIVTCLRSITDPSLQYWPFEYDGAKVDALERAVVEALCRAETPAAVVDGILALMGTCVYRLGYPGHPLVAGPCLAYYT